MIDVARLVAVVAAAATATVAQAATEPHSQHMPLGDHIAEPLGVQCLLPANPRLPDRRKVTRIPDGAVGSDEAAGALFWESTFQRARSRRETETASIAANGRTRRPFADRVFVDATWGASIPLAFAALRLTSPVADTPGTAAAAKTTKVACSRPARVNKTRMPSTSRSQLEFSAENRALLQRINQRVNDEIRPASDWAIHHVSDVWGAVTTPGPRYGDCEDYVLAKRTALIEQGISPELLSIAVARTAAGTVHAVLIVETSDGDYVMDNLSYWVAPWRDTSYSWTMRQQRGQAWNWRKIVVKTTPG